MEKRHSSTWSSAFQQYYLAVDTARYKVATFAELLDVISGRGSVAVAVCCCSRDVLDMLADVISDAKHVSLLMLHSDMGEVERALVLDQFRAFIEYERIVRADEGLDKESEGYEKQIERKVYVLLMTDACIPTTALGEAPLGVRLLLNYELPLKKEAYVRRIGACFGPAAATAIDKVSDGSGVGGGLGSSPVHCSPGRSPGHGGGIVINFLTASEVPLLRSIEEGCGICIDEMPIHIYELL